MVEIVRGKSNLHFLHKAYSIVDTLLVLALWFFQRTIYSVLLRVGFRVKNTDRVNF